MDELNQRIRSTLHFDFEITSAEAEQAAARWAGGVKNFDRSPGGFSAADAARALYDLTAARG
jgi:hypothetical protein